MNPVSPSHCLSSNFAYRLSALGGLLGRPFWGILAAVLQPTSRMAVKEGDEKVTEA